VGVLLDLELWAGRLAEGVRRMRWRRAEEECVKGIDGERRLQLSSLLWRLKSPCEKRNGIRVKGTKLVGLNSPMKPLPCLLGGPFGVDYGK